MLKRIVICLLLSVVFWPQGARAQEYAAPTWTNLVRTMIRFNALDISDDLMADDYAMIAECGLYKAYSGDEFKWHDVKKALRDSVRMNMPSYPTNYRYDAAIRLGRYDFKNKIYGFSEENTLRGINSFVLYEVEGQPCDVGEVGYVPRAFRAMLSAPIALDGLPLSEKDAQALSQRVKKDNDGLVYARYNIRTIYIEPLQKMSSRRKKEKEEPVYGQSLGKTSKEVRFDAELDSIGFYEDRERTKLIYVYAP